MEFNKSPIAVTHGKVIIDGVECLDSIKFNIKITPRIWKGRLLGEKTPSSRWLDYEISGEITRRRSNPWLIDTIKKHMKAGTTPELTIQGVLNDTNSDYYKKHGKIDVVALGCVLTGDFTLISLDTGGEVLDDTIAFNAKEIK